MTAYCPDCVHYPDGTRVYCERCEPVSAYPTPLKRDSLAPAATFELRTHVNASTDAYASALVQVLTRWARGPQALAVARRMVELLTPEEPQSPEE